MADAAALAARVVELEEQLSDAQADAQAAAISLEQAVQVRVTDARRRCRCARAAPLRERGSRLAHTLQTAGQSASP
jgi:hypothetical protein